MPAGVVYLVPSDITAQFDALQARGEETSSVMSAIAEMFVLRVNEEFDTAGHGTWKKLAPKTLARRRKQGKGAEPLKDTDRAAGSIRAESTNNSAEAATDVSYMIFHVSEAPRKWIPLRNPFDIPDDAFDEATEMIVAHVTR